MRIAIDDISAPDMLAFRDYWDSLKGERFAPTWREFDLSALDPKIVPYIVVVDVHHDPLDFIVRFWGTAHVIRKGVDKTGKSISQAPDIRPTNAFEEYKDVVVGKVPVAVSDFVNLQDFTSMLNFEQTLIRLPLSDDGVDVHNVVTLASWDKV